MNSIYRCDVKVTDLGKSWKDGLAFGALIASFRLIERLGIYLLYLLKSSYSYLDLVYLTWQTGNPNRLMSDSTKLFVLDRKNLESKNY